MTMIVKAALLILNYILSLKGLLILYFSGVLLYIIKTFKKNFKGVFRGDLV